MLAVVQDEQDTPLAQPGHQCGRRIGTRAPRTGHVEGTQDTRREQTEVTTEPGIGETGIMFLTFAMMACAITAIALAVAYVRGRAHR
ncbi:hypothetical protein [Streptomyces sp. NPDC015350]|uniref:hypothetical protein n=1 Tax=Streptomyces sp. NPDC015350 TaxID=3364955 RepID=UPI0036F8DB9D